MRDIQPETLETITSPRLQQQIDEVHEYWQGVDPYTGVETAIKNTFVIEPTEDTSRAYVLEPPLFFDDSRTLALSLPYLNGFSSQHYVRAETMRRIINPFGRVVVLPENSSQQRYNVAPFNNTDTAKLAMGDYSPFGERQMRTLELADSLIKLGSVMLTGYSKGGLTAISMAAAGSDKLNVTHVNADEVPSKVGRTPKQLERDFMKSGTLMQLRKAIGQAEIEPLSRAMRSTSLAQDLAKFGIASKSKNGKLMRASMQGSVDYDLERALHKVNGAVMKVGFVEGSRVFDPDSLSPRTIRALGGLVKYLGPGFHGHASADDVIVHALMVNDCLVRS